MAILDAALAWLHILGAIGWMGVAMFLGIVLGPTLGRLSPATRSELIIKLFPRFLSYVRGFASLTVIMGVGLALVISNGDLAVFAPTNSFGLYISAGAGIALVATIIAMGLVLPSAKKVLKITRELAEKPGPPPVELMKASRRMGTGAIVTLILLVIVLVFMVAAANP